MSDNIDWIKAAGKNKMVVNDLIDIDRKKIEDVYFNSLETIMTK